jgi:hypothetical protein
LPDDDAGREYLKELLLPISLWPHEARRGRGRIEIWGPTDKMRCEIKRWAPWMSEDDDTCSALGVTVRSSSPVLALCRQLVDAGHDPTTPLEAYRRNTLALRVKSIGQTAQLEVNADGTGFWQRAKARAAPPMRPNLEALFTSNRESWGALESARCLQSPVDEQ